MLKYLYALLAVVVLGTTYYLTSDEPAKMTNFTDEPSQYPSSQTIGLPQKHIKAQEVKPFVADSTQTSSRKGDPASDYYNALQAASDTQLLEEYQYNYDGLKNGQKAIFVKYLRKTKKHANPEFISLLSSQLESNDQNVAKRAVGMLMDTASNAGIKAAIDNLDSTGDSTVKEHTLRRLVDVIPTDNENKKTVDYLETEILQQSPTDMMTQGAMLITLARIGNKESIESLINIWHTSDTPDLKERVENVFASVYKHRAIDPLKTCIKGENTPKTACLKGLASVGSPHALGTIIALTKSNHITPKETLESVEDLKNYQGINYLRTLIIKEDETLTSALNDIGNRRFEEIKIRR